MYSEETKASSLAKLLSNFDLVLLDTCSLMEDSFPNFMDALVASRGYWKEGLRVVILGECMDELKKHSKSGEHEKRINAKRALKIVKHDQSIWNRNKVLKIEKALHKDAFADRAIYAKVSDLRISQKILVITQDKKLKADIRGLNNLESQKGRNIHVYQIGRHGDLEIKFDDRSAPVPARNFNGKKPVEKPENKPFEEKPKAPQKPKNPDKSQVILKENALLANISNPNYAVNKKIEDIDAQIALLKGLSQEEKKQLNLKLTEEKLLLEKKKLEAPKPKEKEPVQKNPVKEQKPQKQETVKKPYYEYGKTPVLALKKLGDHYGWMFRDPSVAYFSGVHGPIDLTSDDLAVAEEAASLKPETSTELVIKSLTFVFEHTKNEFHVYLKPVEEKKEEQAAKVEAKPKKTKAPAKKKEEKKVEEPVKEEKPKQESKPKKTKKKAVEKTEKPAEEKKVEEPVVEKQKANKPKKSTAKAKKEEKPVAEATPKADEKAPASKKKAPKKAKEPANSAQKPEIKHSSGFAEAEKNDKILNANLNNPNYPKASAIKDIEEQLVRIRHLKPGESKELKFGIKALQAKLKELK